jgi:hypothetical protein
MQKSLAGHNSHLHIILLYRLLSGLHFLPQLRRVRAVGVKRQPFNLNRVFDHDLVFLFQALSTGCETSVRHSMDCCLRVSVLPRWQFSLAESLSNKSGETVGSTKPVPAPLRGDFLLLFLSKPRKSVRKNQKARNPQTNEDAKPFCVRAVVVLS